MLAVQSVFSMIISATIIKLFDMGDLFTGIRKGDIIVGVLACVTMFSSNYALKFVSFPMMALAKSAKILPVIITGWL